MIDAELLETLERKTPDQLSLLELERLRTSLWESEELRTELLQRRDKRAYLAEALARIDVSLDALLAQVPQRATPGRRMWRGVAALLVLLLIGVGATAARWSPWIGRRSPDVAEAEQPDDAKKKENEATKDAADANPADADNAQDEGQKPSESPASQKPSPEGPSSESPASAADPSSPAKPQPAPPRPSASGPWDAVLRAEAPAADFLKVCFRAFQTSRTTPSKDEVALWFTPMNAHASVGEKRTSVGNCGAITGLLRLQAPLAEGAALRFALEEYDRLKIHAFHGEQGATLVFYQNQNFAWSAYHTTRQAGAPQPDRYVLAGTDNSRNQRTEIRHGGPYELRYHGGALLLSRGDVLLVSAALAGPPTDVFFEGNASFLGLTMVKTGEVPFAAPKAFEAPLRSTPAELAWKPTLAEGAEFNKRPDGAVELIGRETKQRGYVVAPLPGEGLREVVLQLDAVSPGTAVFLGRGAEGRPFEIVKFLLDQRTGRLCVALHGDDDAFERQFEPLEERTAPFVVERPWLRLLFGCGILRCWISPDGVHWAEPFLSLRTGLPGEVTHLGLHVAARRPDCRLVLQSVHTRPLTALPALADEALRRRAPAFPQAADYGEWLAQATAAQPADVDAQAWRRACAVNALAGGCAMPLGEGLVNALLDDAALRLPVEQQLALLDEAALLLDLQSDHNRLLKFLGRYHELGGRAYEAGDKRPFSLVRRAMMTAPIATVHRIPLGGETLIRAELIELLDARQWQAALDFCEMLRFYRLDENLPLTAFARALAQREAPDEAGAEVLIEQRDAWRHPLVEELSKDAYNFLAEFQALLESEAFDEAARMIVAVEPHAAPGVAADRRDPRLLVSLPAAIRLAMRDWPQLQAVMEEQFTDLAELRIRRAVGQGDEAAVRSAALQFDATPAAALAAQWLGDRALSRGYFEQALSLYDRAERTADSLQRTELAPRKRLAGAMLGRDLGSSVSSTVELGDEKIPAEEFEAIIAQMRQRAAAAPETLVHGAAAAPRIQPPPSPTGFAAHVRDRFEGPAGEKPNEPPRQVRSENVDWVARQLAWVVDGDTLYVSNRFHVAAYDLANGKRKPNWQISAPPGKAARSHDWSLTPMRPLATEKHLLVRQLNGDGPLLACVDKQNGKVVWTSQPPQGEWLASDPLPVQGRLLTFRLRRDNVREMTLLLCDYDSATGEPLDQQEVLRLREPSWMGRFVCQAAVADDAVIAVLGGCVVCVDLAGGVRWVRKQLYSPADEDPHWGGQHHEPPLVSDNRVFLIQPGVHTIECVDPDTGRNVWTRVLPEVQRLLGAAEDRLIVETRDGFRALDTTSGETQWRHAAAGRLEGRFCDQSRLLYVRRIVADREDPAPRPELVWLDTKTGEPTATTVLTELNRKELVFGPMIAHKDRLWTFAGSGPHDPHRDFVELVPQGEAARPHVLAENIWLRHFAAVTHEAAARVLPDWRVFRGLWEEKHSGHHADLQGEKDVLSLDGSRNQPVLFARQVTIPQGARARLRMRLAMEQFKPSQLSVEFRGEPLWEQKLDEQTLGLRTWRDFEADLASRAGQTGWLMVRLTADNDERFTSYWKRLEVAF